MLLKPYNLSVVKQQYQEPAEMRPSKFALLGLNQNIHTVNCLTGHNLFKT
jgi:hypothetical protein